MRLRAATAADAAVATALIVAVDIAQLGEADYSHEALLDEWGEVDFELASDAVLVEDDRGTAIGYAHFRGGDLLAAVDPRREGEGAGTLLLEWAERRGREKGLERLRQAVGHLGANALALLQARGWQYARSFWRMERDTRPEDAEPPGLRAVTAADAAALYVLHEAAFSRVGGYTPTREEVWVQREFHGHGFDAALGRVAEAEGAPVGFALARRWEQDIVYVPLLAVHPEHAGRGLGGALLTGVFAAAARAGLRQVQLNVAADNPSAVRLYERVGMSQRWRLDEYQKPLPH
jgi:ribosomal protein S18 acetylase RimI-like enzyme